MRPVDAVVAAVHPVRPGAEQLPGRARGQHVRFVPDDDGLAAVLQAPESGTELSDSSPEVARGEVVLRAGQRDLGAGERNHDQLPWMSAGPWDPGCRGMGGGVAVEWRRGWVGGRGPSAPAALEP